MPEVRCSVGHMDDRTVVEQIRRMRRLRVEHAGEYAGAARENVLVVAEGRVLCDQDDVSVRESEIRLADELVG